ncbi:MAG: DUF262 domain-containing HNH endonuclease family protein [Dehalococcoidia bacterium]
MNITPTALKVSQMLGSEIEQYVIPAYQRRYSWRRHQVDDLWDDIAALEEADTHLLGTIVCLTDQHTAGINRLELVDGQQRLTTISILLHCLLARLRSDGKESEAQDVERLLVAKPPKGSVEPKIALDSLDARQFGYHASGQEPPQIENAHLKDAFAHVAGRVSNQTTEEAVDFAYKLRNQAAMVRLDVSAAKDAFKLFETINNRGLRLSSTDIIKNFMLGNAARFGEEALEGARERWAQVVRHLDGVSAENFFRQYMSSHLGTPVTIGLVVEEFQWAFMNEVVEAERLPERDRYRAIDPDVDEEDDDDEAEVRMEAAQKTRADDDDEPEKLLPKVSFAVFLDRLVSSSQAYREIVLAETGRPRLDRRLRNLALIRAQPSYGFLMTLRNGGCSEKDFEAILKLTESFMLRRHVCRERTNENVGIFARLSKVDPNNAVLEVRRVYREYSPSDERFRQEFAAANYTPRLMDRARYCLEQIEMHLQGEFPELIPGGPADVHIEHIVPQRIWGKKLQKQIGDWPTYLGAGAGERHSRLVGRFGNLTLFAGELNIGASNNPYARKKKAYKESAFKLTSGLPSDYPGFRFAQIEARSKKLADIAVQLWPVA